MLKIKIALCLLYTVNLFSCANNEAETVKEEYFFSLENYFEQESQRLTKQHPLILKEVNRNDASDVKEINIQDWKKEFGLFIESDINKLSWKDSYLESIHNDSLLYKSKDPKLRTQEVLIIKNNGQIRKISVKNTVENFLYKSHEHLVYYPDSSYQIIKHQDIIILGSNKYHISGYFR